jgi:hypothetical protein
MIRPSERAGMDGNVPVIWGRSQEEFLIFGIFILMLLFGQEFRKQPHVQ